MPRGYQTSNVQPPYPIRKFGIRNPRIGNRQPLNRLQKFCFTQNPMVRYGAFMKRVLVACEYSGRVRDAFAARGWDAWSCDFEESETTGNHYRGDVRDLLTQRWDMMIAFPPCTYLCSSGMHWTTRGLRDPKLTEDALAFVHLLLNSGIPRIAIENPIGAINTRICKPSQIIQPWQFGDDASKRTCLWLRNLPLLVPTDILPMPPSGRWANQTPSGQNKLGPSPTRWKERSKTYPGIARAMADQWGDLAL